MSILSAVVAASIWSAAATSVDSAEGSKCSYNAREMFELGIFAFDQDADVGWRSIAKQPGCTAEAADMISRYRRMTIQALPVLHFHEGQLLAESGNTSAAIKAFEQAYRDNDVHGFNYYVDATIAFLKKDKASLDRARSQLARVPVPANYEYIDENGQPQSGRPPDWPYNLKVIDRMIVCFERSYKEMYQEADCGS